MGDQPGRMTDLPEPKNARAALIGVLQRKVARAESERDRLAAEVAALQETIKQMRWAERRRRVEAKQAEREQAQRESLHALLNPDEAKP